MSKLDALNKNKQLKKRISNESLQDFSLDGKWTEVLSDNLQPSLQDKNNRIQPSESLENENAALKKENQALKRKIAVLEKEILSK